MFLLYFIIDPYDILSNIAEVPIFPLTAHTPGICILWVSKTWFLKEVKIELDLYIE
jgi:hypothetical protein